MTFKNLTTSEKTDQIFPALLAVWTELDPVNKKLKNDHFKNMYADINAVIEEIKPVFLKNGLLLMQPPVIDPENSRKVSIETIILHVASQQFITNLYYLEAVDNKPQSVGSATTYARRYPLASLIGLQSEIDDDGNAASGRGKQQSKPDGKSTAAPAAKTGPGSGPVGIDYKAENTNMKEQIMKATGATAPQIVDYLTACGLSGNDPKVYHPAFQSLLTVINSNPSHYGPEFKKDPKAFGEQWKDAQSKTTAAN